MQLPFGLDWVSFAAGAGLVLVLAFAAFLAGVWWRDATSPFRPQGVGQVTKKTPSQVVVTGFGAVAQYLGFALLVAAAVLLLIFGFSPGEILPLGLAGGVLLILGTVLRGLSQ